MFGVSSCLKNLLNQLLIVVFISSIFLDPAYSAHITLLLAFCTYFRNDTFLDNEIAPFFETPRCTFFRNDKAPLGVALEKNRSHLVNNN